VILSKSIDSGQQPMELPYQGVMMDNNLMSSPIKLEIIEQPPEKAVYKRNVKPSPSVQISGDLKKNDGSFYIAPVLIRCDNFEVEPKHLVGNEPVNITANQTYSFKKLKILVTSRQLNETHFSIRFELRKYLPNMTEYQVLDQVTTNPMCVYSHSTQLKPTPKTKPKISEIIPGIGSPNGQTRVAILGNNFVDSPTTRVRFGDIEVIPIFHGPKTLICETPKHPPGKVNVQVCLEPGNWGNTGTYHFDESLDFPQSNGYEFNMNNVICGI